MNELMATGEPAHLSVRDQVLQLRSQPMFEGLDDEALLLLAEQGRSATYEDGDVVAVEGEPARAVYLVVAGELVVTREGKELGEIVCEPRGLLRAERRNRFSIVAICACRGCRVRIAPNLLYLETRPRQRENHRIAE